jgi:hypothetical protein
MRTSKLHTLIGLHCAALALAVSCSDLGGNDVSLVKHAGHDDAFAYDGELQVSLSEVVDEAAAKYKLLFAAPKATKTLVYCRGVDALADCKSGSTVVRGTKALGTRSGKAFFMALDVSTLKDGLTLAIVARDGAGKTLDSVLYRFGDKKKPNGGGSGGGTGSDGAGDGRPAYCQKIPSWSCKDGDAACQKLVRFDEDQANGWFVDNRDLSTTSIRDKSYLTTGKPLYGFSYMRRDMQVLMQYAAMSAICDTYNVPGSLGPLGFGDLSDSAGRTPAGRHPTGSHDGGMNADIAYFQNNGRLVNSQVPVCPDGDNHCLGAPQQLDVERTAYFVAHIHEYPYVDVVAMDAQIGPLVLKKMADLCDKGRLNDASGKPLRVCRERGVRLWWDASPAEDLGWYHFHHHHMHVRISPQKASTPDYFEPLHSLGSGATYSAAPLREPEGVGCGLD